MSRVAHGRGKGAGEARNDCNIDGAVVSMPPSNTIIHRQRSSLSCQLLLSGVVLLYFGTPYPLHPYTSNNIFSEQNAVYVEMQLNFDSENTGSLEILKYRDAKPDKLVFNIIQCHAEVLQNNRKSISLHRIRQNHFLKNNFPCVMRIK